MSIMSTLASCAPVMVTVITYSCDSGEVWQVGRGWADSQLLSWNIVDVRGPMPGVLRGAQKSH